MHSLEGLLYRCVPLLCIAVMSGVFRYHRLNRPMKILLGLIFLISFSEGVVFYAEQESEYGAVIHFFRVLELFLTITYFLHILFLEPKRELIILAFFVALVIGIANYYLFSIWRNGISYMLLTESLVLVGFALMTVLKLELMDNSLLQPNILHLKVSISLLLLWTLTFFYSGMESYFYFHPSRLLIPAETMLSLLKTGIYGYIGYLLLKIDVRVGANA